MAKSTKRTKKESKQEMIGDLPVHPLVNVFSKMSKEALMELQKDIAANGCREATILTADGQLLDGWHREAACLKLGITPERKTLGADVDLLRYVVSANLHRRHMTTGQRAMSAAEVATRVNGSNQHSTKGSQNWEPSIDEAAKVFGVSSGSVCSAKRIKREGCAALIKLVLADGIKVGAAETIVAGLPVKKDQSALIASGDTKIDAFLKRAKAKKEKQLGRKKQRAEQHDADQQAKEDELAQQDVEEDKTDPNVAEGEVLSVTTTAPDVSDEVEVDEVDDDDREEQDPDDECQGDLAHQLEVLVDGLGTLSFEYEQFCNDDVSKAISEFTIPADARDCLRPTLGAFKKEIEFLTNVHKGWTAKLKRGAK